MPVDPDDELQDEPLRRVVAELRRPVRLDPEVDRQALRAIQEGQPAGRARLWRWGAVAAVAAGLFMVGLLRTPSGNSPAAAPVATAEAGTRQVLLQLASPASSRVSVVGDFNDWDPSATPLRPTGTKGIWSVKLRLKPGRYHYTFLIDGRKWERDPSGSPAAGSDFGAPVSVLTVI